MIYQNHVIDPTFFYDAIEEFAFNYNWYPQSKPQIDNLGKKSYSYTSQIIRGSLQNVGNDLRQNEKLNTEEVRYEFYCKSLYRISVGDFIQYKNKYLRVMSFRDLDEWGVRSCVLQSVNLYNYKDFQEYLNYLNGEMIV